MKIRTLILSLLLLLAPTLYAQTAATTITPPPDIPIQHFVLSGSAVGFKGASGTQTASLASAGIQVMNNFSAAYEQLNIPSLSTNYVMGVGTYTRPLNELLGPSLASKLSFDTTTINVSFQGGLGKVISPKGSNIAETLGAFISYPVAQNVSLQIIGYSYFHGGGQAGTVSFNTTTALSTGLVFSF